MQTPLAAYPQPSYLTNAQPKPIVYAVDQNLIQSFSMGVRPFPISGFCLPEAQQGLKMVYVHPQQQYLINQGLVLQPDLKGSVSSVFGGSI